MSRWVWVNGQVENVMPQPFWTGSGIKLIREIHRGAYSDQ